MREGSATGRSRSPRCKPPEARRRFGPGLRSLGSRLSGTRNRDPASAGAVSADREIRKRASQRGGGHAACHRRRSAARGPLSSPTSRSWVARSMIAGHVASPTISPRCSLRPAIRGDISTRRIIDPCHRAARLCWSARLSSAFVLLPPTGLIPFLFQSNDAPTTERSRRGRN